MLKLDPKQIYLVLPFGSAPYEDPDFQIFIKQSTNDPKSPFIGILNTLDDEPGLSALDQESLERIKSATLQNLESKNAVLRTFPIYNLKENRLTPTLQVIAALQNTSIDNKSTFDKNDPRTTGKTGELEKIHTINFR